MEISFAEALDGTKWSIWIRWSTSSVLCRENNNEHISMPYSYLPKELFHDEVSLAGRAHERAELTLCWSLLTATLVSECGNGERNGHCICVNRQSELEKVSSCRKSLRTLNSEGLCSKAKRFDLHHGSMLELYLPWSL